MLNKIIISLLLCYSTTFWSQTIDCKRELDTLKITITAYRSQLSSEVTAFNDLINQSTVSTFNDSLIALLKDKQIKIEELKKQIIKNIDGFNGLKQVCVAKNAISDNDINDLLKDLNLYKKDLEAIIDPKKTEKQTYIYFNKDQIIKEDVISNNGIQGKILNDIIGQTNQETYLGDITIPKDNQEFFFYERRKVLRDTTKNKKNNTEKDSIRLKEYTPTTKKFKFKSIDIQISDGNFYDIRLEIEYDGNVYIFENFKAVSFFRFNTMARKNFLQYSNKQPFGVGDKTIECYAIRLSDVLFYEYKIGNNFIPSNLVLELPQKDINDLQTNLTAPTTYQIKEDTYLDKIIELRAYTDFLALFDDASNGLLQIEGSAKFYIFPFSRQIPFYTGQLEFLKSVTPYVNYSKFENGNKYAMATDSIFNQEMDLIEKRYLSMGFKLNCFELYHKNYPIKANIFGVVDYNLTQAQNNELDPEIIKSLGYGFGLNIASKRFNNFGFSYNVEFKWFDFANFNTTNNMATNFNVPVFKNQAEIFYHPTNNPNQAIFVRLNTFNYKGASNNQAFYQFQFGYKFSIGSRTVAK